MIRAYHVEVGIRWKNLGAGVFGPEPVRGPSCRPYQAIFDASHRARSTRVIIRRPADGKTTAATSGHDHQPEGAQRHDLHLLRIRQKNRNRTLDEFAGDQPEPTPARWCTRSIVGLRGGERSRLRCNNRAYAACAMGEYFPRQ